MFCSNCGKEIRENSNFCPYCGIAKKTIPSEAAKQTPVQDTSVSAKKNGFKAFRLCSNCGKAIGGNSDFCPYCGTVERAIPSETARQIPVQDTSVAAKQNKFKGFWGRKFSVEKQAVVAASLLYLFIIGILVYHMIKNRDVAYIDTLNMTPERFVGRDICTKGWVAIEEDGFFRVSEWPYYDSSLGIVVDGRALEKLPEVGDAVSVRGEWEMTEEGIFWLEADEVDYLNESDESALLDFVLQRASALY